MGARTATVLVVTGSFGLAARLDLGTVTQPDRETVIDDWLIHPTEGRKVSLLVVRTPGRYTLTIAHLLDFALVQPLPVATDHQAREAARHLVRAVVNGVLPAEPGGPNGHMLWRVSVDTVARIVARTWPEQREGG